MFSQVCVRDSVHKGGGGVYLGRHPPKADILSQADTPPDGHCSGRYASYWNAFLLFMMCLSQLYWMFSQRIYLVELELQALITTCIRSLQEGNIFSRVCQSVHSVIVQTEVNREEWVTILC